MHSEVDAVNHSEFYMFRTGYVDFQYLGLMWMDVEAYL